jgi:hypothetical protein
MLFMLYFSSDRSTANNPHVDVPHESSLEDSLMALPKNSGQSRLTSSMFIERQFLQAKIFKLLLHSYPFNSGYWPTFEYAAARFRPDVRGSMARGIGRQPAREVKALAPAG